jgi:hypothetical protein
VSSATKSDNPVTLPPGRDRLDDGLPAIIDVDVLDPNELLAAMPKTLKHLDLDRIGSQQPCRGRAKG